MIRYSSTTSTFRLLFSFPALVALSHLGDQTQDVHGQFAISSPAVRLHYARHSTGTRVPVRVIRNGTEDHPSIHIGTIPVLQPRSQIPLASYAPVIPTPFPSIHLNTPITPRLVNRSNVYLTYPLPPNILPSFIHSFIHSLA
ncbi:hypothetical protein HOY82DRAFT_572645 [Tuber indicum]|nr:hypothetical protein HOY82DRAFT_572645 [Tuber indicum]